MFKSNDDMIFQLKEDLKERIFDTSNKEEFLSLKEIILCTYEYIVNQNL